MSNALLRAIDSPNIRRAAALALFLGLPALLGAVTATTVMETLVESAETEAKSNLLAQMQTQLKARQQSRTASRDVTPIYLASPSASLGRAELLSLLDRLIAAAGGRLIETQMVAEQGSEPPESIALQTTLDIGNDGLADLLHAIETGLPVLNVHEITVVRAPRREEAGPTLLRVTLVVHGYRKAKAA